MQLLNRIRLDYFYLIFIIVLGTFFRLYDLDNLGFGWDDSDHIQNLSNPGAPLGHIIRNSYVDAHPPLRNILIHLIAQISMEPIWVRAVAWLPGVLLIPLVYVWLGRLFRSPFAAGVGATIVALGFEFIRLSMSTRPYMLLSVFMLIYLICWHRYLEESKTKWLILIMLSGALSAFSHYGTVLYVIPAVIVGAVVLFKASDRNRYRQICFFCMASAFPLVILLGQFLLIQYLNPDYSQGLARSGRFGQPIEGFGQLFSTLNIGLNYFSFDPAKFSGILMFFSSCGLALFLWYRRFSLFFLYFSAVAANVFLHWFGFYPFVYSRQSVPLILLALPAIGFSSMFLFNLFNQRRGEWCWKIFCFGLAFWSISPSSIFHMSTSNYFLGRYPDLYAYSGSDVNAMHDYIRNHARPGDVVLLPPMTKYLLLLNAVDFGSWARELPPLCEVSDHHGRWILLNADQLNETEKEELSATLKETCPANDTTRFWCMYCRAAPFGNTIEQQTFSHNSLLLFSN